MITTIWLQTWSRTRLDGDRAPGLVKWDLGLVYKREVLGTGLLLLLTILREVAAAGHSILGVKLVGQTKRHVLPATDLTFRESDMFYEESAGNVELLSRQIKRQNKHQTNKQERIIVCHLVRVLHPTLFGNNSCPYDISILRIHFMHLFRRLVDCPDLIPVLICLHLWIINFVLFLISRIV